MGIHKIKAVSTLPDMRLNVQFTNGSTKIYDVKATEEHLVSLSKLKDQKLFDAVMIENDGYGILWSAELKLPSEELWDKGMKITTPFDGLMSFADASELWGLSESTLRKAVAYGKIVAGIDARKYGKQWIITYDAMVREYGEATSKCNDEPPLK